MNIAGAAAMAPSVRDAPALPAAQAAALAAVGEAETAARSLVHYESCGCLLIFGDAVRARQTVDALGGKLRIVVMASGDLPPQELPRDVRWMRGRLTAVDGRLGRFSATAASADGPADIGIFSFRDDRFFDLVLDLGSSPLLTTEVLPLGYFFPGNDPAALQRALDELPEKTGRISKPRYFAYDAARCAHGASGLIGCDACLSVCPTEAIHPAGDGVAVDPYLCQGCGTCSLVCPTGAIRYAYPAPQETLARIVRGIDAWRAHSPHTAPVVLVHEDRTPGAGAALAAAFGPRVLPIGVFSLASIGPELWFATLAAGAAAIALLPAQSMPASTVAALDRQLSLARALLSGLGQAAQRLALIANPNGIERLPDGAAVGAEPRETTTTDKRGVWFDALAALTISADMVPLEIGAPFGGVDVDRNKCTLCSACANLCPTGALVAEGGERLYFLESRCVQCGLCVAACPEKAVGLTPRFLADPGARDTSRLMQETELARCVECGTPFMSRSLLEASIAHVRDFPMFRDPEGLNRLRMCNACRMQASMREGTGWFPER